MLRVHYHRFDNDYEGVGLWTWAPEGYHLVSVPEKLPAGWDDFGPYFDVDPQEYFAGGGKGAIGLLPRLRHDWKLKDGEDRFWTATFGHEIWILGGDSSIYTARPDTSPRVQAAFLDSDAVIVIKLSHSLELSQVVPRNFTVRNAASDQISIADVRPLEVKDGRSRIMEITSEDLLDYATRYTVQVRGYKSARVQLRDVLLDPEKFLYNGELGAIYAPAGTTFRLFAPEAEQAHIVLYNDARLGDDREVHAMKPLDKGVWEVRIPGDLHGRFYRVRVLSDDSHTGREVVDPYSRINTGHDGHGAVADLRRLDPEGFRPITRPRVALRPTDAVIWEMHVRDFSISPSSGAEEPWRGKYLGATQRGTRIPGTNVSTGIDHLVELGVTHVQILPIQDFDNDESGTQYSWGYMPVNFFSPDGWFATNIRDFSRVVETKQMIKAFHDAGIRVILDVVYNHTAPMASFEAIAPRYYHRRRNEGSFWNGSGCGNEFRSEAPMARKHIVDACRYWVEEYGVDGFRFDLMGLIDLDTMKAIRDEILQIDEHLLLYGEPWAAAPPDQVGINRITSKFMITGTGIAAFNDHLRDDIKGDPRGTLPGYVQGGTRRDALKRGIQGAIYDWSWHPTDVIQYVACHDDYTLWDKLTISAPAAGEDERIHMHLLALGILLVSQGTIVLHAGTEMLRTKSGNHNSYDAPDDINQIDWSRKAKYPRVFEFVKNMIAIRRAHPIFRLATREEIEARMHFHEKNCPHESCLSFGIYGGNLEGERWEDSQILINPEPRALEFPLLKGSWNIHAIGEKVSPRTPLETVEKRLIVPGRGMALLARSN